LKIAEQRHIEINGEDSGAAVEAIVRWAKIPEGWSESGRAG
jgi:hypothetical protein